MLLVETIFDTLNAKSSLFAIDEYFEASGQPPALIISGTVTDASGACQRSDGHGIWYSARHARPLLVGLQLRLGAALMRPYLQELARCASDTFMQLLPQRGPAQPMSDTGFDETPDVTSRLPARVRRCWAGQHRGRLLRHHACAHRGDPPGSGAAVAADAAFGLFFTVRLRKVSAA